MKRVPPIIINSFHGTLFKCHLKSKKTSKQPYAKWLHKFPGSWDYF